MSTQWYQASNFLALLWKLFHLHGPSDSRQSQRLQDLWTVLWGPAGLYQSERLLPFHRDYCGGGHVTSLAKEMDTSLGAAGKAFRPWQKEQAIGEESTAAPTPLPLPVWEHDTGCSGSRLATMRWEVSKMPRKGKERTGKACVQDDIIESLRQTEMQDFCFRR